MCRSIPPRTTERMDMWQGDSALLWGVRAFQVVETDVIFSTHTI